MALSSSVIEVSLAMQRARENEARRLTAFLQSGTNENDTDERPEVEEEETEMDTCWSWCVCIGALLVNTFLIGIHHAYGVLFIAIRKEFDLSYDTASWLGSLSYGVSAFLGPLSGMVFHKIGHRSCATLGTFIAVGGLIGCSFARDLVELVLAYILMFGLGSSLAYTPAVVVCNAYFERHLGLATGIQISGTTIGGIILPPVVQVLTTSVGFRATMRVLAGIGCLGFVGASTFTGKENHLERQQAESRPSGFRAYLENSRFLLRDPVFLLWLMVMVLVHLGSMTTIVHLVQRGLDVGLTLGEASSAVSLMSVSSALGRIGFGRVLDHPRVSQKLMAQLAIGIMGLSLLLVPAVVNLPLMLVFSLVYGITEGLYVDMIPLMTLRLTGPRGAAVGWSLLVGICSMPWVLGPYLAGLLRRYMGSYDLAFVLCGAVILGGAALLFALPTAFRRRQKAQGAAGERGEGPHDLAWPATDGGSTGPGPIFGYISIQDMPPSYRQQIRFRPGKTLQAGLGMAPANQSTPQTVSNLEIMQIRSAAGASHYKPFSRSQEVVPRLPVLEYDSLAALRRHIPARPPEPAEPARADGGAAQDAPATVAPPEPLPADQLPQGYEALPVAGYLVVAPNSDQARFVVVDSRAGQALLLRASMTPAPTDPADESDAQLRQMLETIVEESRSNITVVDAGEVAHERFSQVRRAVTGWHAHQEADEAEEAASLTESRSVEAASLTPDAEPPQPASRSSVDVRGGLDSPEPARSVSPSDITLSEVARSQEWHERPGSAVTDRARSADARSRRRRRDPDSDSSGGDEPDSTPTEDASQGGERTPFRGSSASSRDDSERPYY